ncbi:MAG: hypothetical protein U9O55_01835 [Patescibacteria group bacterium]|nr:hypothetical protein [Patescibacteria group bacterium]
MAHFNLCYEIICCCCGSKKLTEIRKERRCASGAISRNFRCKECGRTINTYLQVCELMITDFLEKNKKGEE